MTRGKVPPSLDAGAIQRAAKKLAKKDSALAQVYDQLGPPPLWKRPATFATFVRIILEQQVSLASAKSTFEKLKQHSDRGVKPDAVIDLGESGLRDLGFSRQKARYSVALANDVADGTFKIGSLRRLNDDDARQAITARLGLGNWSADVFMMMALMRADLFPVGDLALIKGMTDLDGGDYTTADKAIARSEPWRPLRSVATRMIWQWYLRPKQGRSPSAS